MQEMGIWNQQTIGWPKSGQLGYAKILVNNLELISQWQKLFYLYGKVLEQSKLKTWVDDVMGQKSAFSIIKSNELKEIVKS